MSLFDLLSYTDEEIELVTTALSRWLKTNHLDLQCERGQGALKKAIFLVNSGVVSPDDIVAGLDKAGDPPAVRSPSSCYERAQSERMTAGLG